MTVMEDGSACYVKIILLIIFLSGCLPGVVSSQTSIHHLKPIRLLHNVKILKGPLRFLRDCRRHLTFIASTALGTFITRVINESPLTPLPLPAAEDPARWNFLTLPLHFSKPYIRWIKEYMGNPQPFLKELNDLPPSWRFQDSTNFINSEGRSENPIYRQHMLKGIKISPQVIATAIRRTMKTLQVLQNKVPQQSLTQWCFRR